MALTKVLITVKTYPTLSTTYDELVCTAGLKEDGSWIRIYPIPFRKLDFDNRYTKYQWVELDLERNTRDPRPESFKAINIDEIKLLEKIDTDKGTWQRRRDIVLKAKLYTHLDALITEAKDKKICTSLALFKPKEILDFTIKSVERDWDSKKLAQLNEAAKQTNFFVNSENPFDVVDKIPYKFSYKFKDESDRISELMIEDWEIGMLYRSCLANAEGDEKIATEKVRQKYLDDFARTKDLYLYLGTTKEFHFIAQNPFIIIGTFHPKPIDQMSLF